MVYSVTKNASLTRYFIGAVILFSPFFVLCQSNGEGLSEIMAKIDTLHFKNFKNTLFHFKNEVLYEPVKLSEITSKRLQEDANYESFQNLIESTNNLIFNDNVEFIQPFISDNGSFQLYLHMRLKDDILKITEIRIVKDKEEENIDTLLPLFSDTRYGILSYLGGFTKFQFLWNSSSYSQEYSKISSDIDKATIAVKFNLLINNQKDSLFYDISLSYMDYQVHNSMSQNSGWLIDNFELSQNRFDKLRVQELLTYPALSSEEQNFSYIKKPIKMLPSIEPKRLTNEIPKSSTAQLVSYRPNFTNLIQNEVIISCQRVSNLCTLTLSSSDAISKTASRKLKKFFRKKDLNYDQLTFSKTDFGNNADFKIRDNCDQWFIKSSESNVSLSFLFEISNSDFKIEGHDIYIMAFMVD